MLLQIRAEFKKFLTAYVTLYIKYGYLSLIPYCLCDTAADIITIGSGSPVYQQLKINVQMHVFVSFTTYPNQLLKRTLFS